ncbi:hypothetical protein PAMA_000492 [Pampus argenteus]
MSASNDVWESPGCGTRDALEDTTDTSGFSEHELLDIVYNACNTTNTGEVLASTIIQYLQTMTAQSPEQDRLAALQHLLDPDCQDPLVSRDTFHSTMREWIAQCSQDDDGKDLSGTVAELKQAHRKLSEQNSSLLRTVAQCEDVNLQLTLEITELRAKLASAQRSAVRARSLTEELEETRRAFKEAQDRASRTQTNSAKLVNHILKMHTKCKIWGTKKFDVLEVKIFLGPQSNEVECLKVHIRRLEDKNEKLTFETTCSEDSINKLRKVNAELRFSNDRYDRHCISPQSLYSRDPPNLRSLQSEIQDMQQQQHHRALDDISLPSLHTHSDDIQSIIHRIKSAEIAHLLHNKYPERDSASVETQERPFPHRQQQQASIKQQLVNVLQELELQKCVWEEKGEKVEERLRAREKEQKQSHTGKQTPKPEAKKVAVVNWWKVLSLEGVKARTKDTQSTQELSERAKLQQAEQMISDMREQVCQLQASLKSARECVTEQKNSSRVVLIHKGTNTEIEEADRAEEKVVKDQRDAAVATDPVEITSGAASEQEQTNLRVTADGLLATLRRMEAMVNNALETAKLVRESEQRVSQVRVRMESITQKVEEALTRAANTDKQLSGLEARITEKAPTQPPDPKLSADPELDAASFTTESDLEAEDRDRMESPPPSPVTPEVSDPPQLPMNGMMAALQKYSFSHVIMVTNRYIHSTSFSIGNPRGCLKIDAEDIYIAHNSWYSGTGRGICDEQPKEAYRALLLKWSKLPGVKERLLLKKDREQRGREKEGESQRIEEFSAEKAESDSVTVGSRSGEISRSECLQGTSGALRRYMLVSLQQCQTCVEEEEKHFLQGSLLDQSYHNYKESIDASCAAERPFTFPHTRSRPSLPPAMPTLPEEEEDSPEELDSSSSSPSTATPGESRAVVMSTPTIIYPQQTTIVQQDGRPLEQARPHSPRARLARNSSGGSITRVDSTGNVIDLVKDQLPELQLSEEDRQKNLELLEQAKKVSDRFLTRRGRRSTSSLTDSPTAVGLTEMAHVSSQSVGQGSRLLVDWKPTEKRKVSSGTLTPRFAVQKENCDPGAPKSPPAVNKIDEGTGLGRNPIQAPATGVAKPVPRPPTQQAPCTAEIKTIGAFPPLMRAVSWDAVGSLNSRNGAPSFPSAAEDTFSDKPRDAVFKSSGYKDLPTQPGGTQKLSKLREEHKLIRNQSVVGSKLPDLSEAAEQEKGPPASPNTGSSEEMKEKSDAMPNISDVMLRKLKLHRGLPGCAPPLTEKEVENAFVQLSLAFRNDNYTLETRLKQAERERNLTEEDTEKELEEFKGALKWQNLEQREAYQRLIETVAVLHRLATRLSSRAEIVGAVRQEKRMNKATEVMMQYVENLKRTYEKDHAELMEFKKLANQNSNRCYGGSVDNGAALDTGMKIILIRSVFLYKDDGVLRPSRSMSLTLGKALPRRRVSVAVVPKFNLLNIPGQNPVTAGPGVNPASGPTVGPTAGAALPVLDLHIHSSLHNVCRESGWCPNLIVLSFLEQFSGKSVLEQESEPAKPAVNLEEIRAEIRAEIKAKIEEEAYSKGLQEGLKQNKALQEEKHEEDAAEKLLESKIKDEESGKKIKTSRRLEEVLVLLGRFWPKITWSKQLLLIALVCFLAMCLIISIFTFFSDYYNRHEDTIMSVLSITAVISGQNITLSHIKVHSSVAGVFHVNYINDLNQPIYAFNASEARALCWTFRANMASKAQVQKALMRGLETCRFGWIDEHLVVIPRIKALYNCGQNQTGLVQWRVSVTKKFDAFCFIESDNAAQLMDTTTHLPSESTYSTSSPIVSSSFTTPSFLNNTDSGSEPVQFLGTSQDFAGAKAVLITLSCTLLLAAIVILAYIKLKRLSQGFDVKQQEEDVEKEECTCEKNVKEPELLIK